MSRPHGIPLPSARRSSDSDETESACADDKQGQPRPREGVRQLTGAERVRTLVESNASVSLTLPDAFDQAEWWTGVPAARTVTPDGDVILLVSGESAAARAAAHAQDDDLTAVIEITDVAPVSVPHRIRARARLAGWLTPVRGDDRAVCAALLAERHPVGELLGLTESQDPPYTGRPAWTMLRLEVGEIALDDLWGAEQVDPDELAGAEPDPLAAHETELLQHLASAHADRVADLCGLLGSRDAGGLTAVPLALDRLGLRVRFTPGPGRTSPSFDARFDFPEPVADVCGLRRAVRALFAAAAH
ncbi:MULTISPECIES: DUF2470 domain-containing protein [Streptomyces]|uniref:DUF2470 domain-containing protein n=1 Tax=Streptomyces lavendulae TaxID=1914 RepID=UPI000F768FFF|nr:DUF2470 domain-containing protein [Streptomyces lavendulae]RST01408.1 DUF2470 domain-containing protein [Streptomyces sp. WAC07149]GLX19156.1 hypothetical protein Slala01_28000 [Streptomyces lavendulae subsp. lavendulae]GLX25876.1 hypothetical protein Slala02_16960 [Streptomyces lavendulae subsp. lavendulae]